MKTTVAGRAARAAVADAPPAGSTLPGCRRPRDLRAAPSMEFPGAAPGRKGV